MQTSMWTNFVARFRCGMQRSRKRFSSGARGGASSDPLSQVSGACIGSECAGLSGPPWFRSKAGRSVAELDA